MTAEDRFKELINGMVVQEIDFPRYITYKKDGKFLIYQDIKTGVCWISWKNICQVLESEYGLNYPQIKELTTTILKQHLKHGVDTIIKLRHHVLNTPETTHQHKIDTIESDSLSQL